MDRILIYQNDSIPARLFIVISNGKLKRSWMKKNGKIIAKNHLVKIPTEINLYHDGWKKIEDTSYNENYS